MKPAANATTTGAGLGRFGRRLVRDQSGAVLVITATFSLVMFGFLALATDVGAWYTMQRSMQSAADAGAMGGAYELAVGQSNAAIETAARDDSGLNGFVHGENGVDVAVTVSGRQVEVIVSQQAPMFFAPLFLDGPPVVAARAVAGLEVNALCMLALHPTMSGALYLDSNAGILVEGCDIHVNSNHSSSAIHSKSNSWIVGTDGATIAVTGGVTVEGVCPNSPPKPPPPGPPCISPIPQTGSPPRDDPLAGVAPPAVGSCTSQPKEYDNVTRTINPGNFCQGLTIKNNANITLNPGIYVISSDKLFVDSNARLQGSGVTFYLTGGAFVDFKSNTLINLTAPTTGALASILFFEDRANATGKPHKFDSNNVSTVFSGIIYLSRNKFWVESNSALGGTAGCTMLIASHFEFNSNASFKLLRSPACPFSFPGETNRPILLV